MFMLLYLKKNEFKIKLRFRKLKFSTHYLYAIVRTVINYSLYGYLCK